jgi:hypothetical protein
MFAEQAFTVEQAIEIEATAFWAELRGEQK